MTDKTVYKVVRIKNGKKYSAIMEINPFRREYKVGHKTKPPRKCPEAWLLAFDNIRDAFEFVDFMFNDYHAIYEAVASETKPCNELPRGLISKELISYWTSITDFANQLIRVRLGSVFCKDITLTRMVWPKYER